MTVEVKNSKNEILEVYHESAQKIKAASQNKQEERIQEEKKHLIAAAFNLSPDEIIKNIANLKLSMVKALVELETKLLAEHKKWVTLQQAVEVQSKEIFDLYEIKVNADTLAALVLAQKEKRAEFDKEMQECQRELQREVLDKRALWIKEQEEFESNRKEHELSYKRARQREEEEYNYKRDLNRKKDHDQYEAKKQAQESELALKRTAFEKEFETREMQLKLREQEFLSLKDKVATFSNQIQKVTQETEKTITEKLKAKYEFETRLMQKEVEGERRLHQQMITSLESKVAQLEVQVKQLTDKANQASLQVQDIALKAIDGASRHRMTETV